MALYAGFGLALPLALHWDVVFLVEINVLSTIVAAVICLAWVIVQMEESTRRHLVEWTTNLRLLDPPQFEWLVGELFRRDGWTVSETGGRDAPDGNTDLVLSASPARGGSCSASVGRDKWSGSTKSDGFSAVLYCE